MLQETVWALSKIKRPLLVLLKVSIISNLLYHLKASIKSYY